MRGWKRLKGPSSIAMRLCETSRRELKALNEAADGSMRGPSSSGSFLSPTSSFGGKSASSASSSSSSSSSAAPIAASTSSGSASIAEETDESMEALLAELDVQFHLTYLNVSQRSGDDSQEPTLVHLSQPTCSCVHCLQTHIRFPGDMNAFYCPFCLQRL